MENYLRMYWSNAAAPSRFPLRTCPDGKRDHSGPPKNIRGIVAGDPDRAEKAAREHVVNVQEFFTKYQIKHYFVRIKSTEISCGLTARLGTAEP